MKLKSIIFALSLAVLSSCSSWFLSRLQSSNMDKLELGMTKVQVANLLGREYTISEKRVEDGKQIEVLSYRNFPYQDEFYLFVFVNNELEQWYRELLPSYEIRENQ